MTALIAIIPIIAICVVAGRRLWGGAKPYLTMYEQQWHDEEWRRLNRKFGND